jgi:4-alpha-glucanotransferase
MTSAQEHLLHNAARLFKVQTVYWDASGRLINPPAEAILRVLRILGAEADNMSDLTNAVRQRRQFLWQRGVEPVAIAWDGDPLRLKLRLPDRLAEASVHYALKLENGQTADGLCDDDARPCAGREIEGIRYVTRRLLIGIRPPLGYHRLELRVNDLTFACVLLASSRQAYSTVDSGTRRWGLFCPLYALRSERSWGAGNFSDLETLLDFAAQRGASFVGTLPLLATFLNELFNPSPYAPVSRLFWNEFYLDIEKIPEFEQSPTAKSLFASAGFQQEIERARSAPLVEYRRIMVLKRAVLEEMMRMLRHQHSPRTEAFERFVAGCPRAPDYAAFRAKVEREGRDWQQWPAVNRDGTLRSSDFDDHAKNYHLYAQWLADEQLEGVRHQSKAGSAADLYLDFPLGVNRDGYDVWRERDVFALGASGGAPPDAFFTQGQNWGFPPLQPEALRQQGYRYYIECVRHHLKRAGMLRVDHVMGLHRSYWIPDGYAATEGVYVHSHAEEYYAVLSLESHRHQAQIVGENLGTVPPYVNAAMARHNIFGMQVSQFLVSGDPWQALQDIPRGTVASLNTHDTPTFAGFWDGADIRDRVDLGILSPAEAEALQRERSARCDWFLHELSARGGVAGAPGLLEILRAWLCHLAGTSGALLLVNLEDLWLETGPQNVPGTWEERPNWQRKARLALEQLSATDAIHAILKEIDAIRRAHS